MKTIVSKMMASNEREKELIEFWYHKGYAVGEMMAKINLLPEKKVEIIVTNSPPNERFY